MKTNFMTYLTTFVIGATAGTTLALLNAPQSGQKTRAQIRRQVSDVRSRTKKAINKVQDRTMDTVDDIQHRVKDISKEVNHQTARLNHQTARLRKASQQMMAKPSLFSGKAK